jgi:Zn-dependent peptidase ImmA (M78 family)
LTEFKKGGIEMPKVSVTIENEIIEWVLRQTNEEMLDDKLMSNINQWLAGKKTPTFNQIEDFSKKSNVPLGYFFLKTPPKENLDLLEYRTVDSVELANPSRNLIDTIYEMEQIQNWMKGYRKETGYSELPIVGSLKNSNDVFEIAKRIREDIEISDDWYSNCTTIGDAFHYIRSHLEESGIIVMVNGIVGKNTHRPLNVNEFRAFALIDDWAPLIFINNVDSQRAKLFSLFHEITHIWLGENDLYNDNYRAKDIKPIENICNAVASELVVPIKKFIVEWNKRKDSDKRIIITELARIFMCSEVVVARKAFDNSFISREMYNNVVDDAMKAYRESREHNQSTGGNYYNTMGTKLDGKFVRALCESVKIGRTTLSEAYRLTNTSRKTFSEVAGRLGGII